MSVRQKIRKVLEMVLDNYRDDRNFTFFKRKEEVLALFDSNSGIDTVGAAIRFCNSLESTFPNEDWRMFKNSFEIYAHDIVTHVGSVAFAEIDVQLKFKGNPVNAGKTKIGGTPDWIQVPSPGMANPTCDNCDSAMTFLLQVDSLGARNSLIELQSLKFADVGMIYLFICQKCWNTYSTLSSH